MKSSRARIGRTVAFGCVGLALTIAAFSAVAGEVAVSRKQCRQYLRQVRVHMGEGRPDSALVYSELAQGCDPRHPDPYWYGAHAHLAQDDLPSAIALLEKGVEAAPLSKRLGLFLVRLYLDRGQVDEARPLIERVLVVHSKDPEALYMNGCLQIAEGDSTAALESWSKALAIATEEGAGR